MKSFRIVLSKEKHSGFGDSVDGVAQVCKIHLSTLNQFFFPAGLHGQFVMSGSE
jgi:hypothetical protein